MASQTPQDKDIDPRLLAQDRLQRPYIPGPPTLPDPSDPPSPVDDGPAQIDNREALFRQGVEEASRGWLESLPLDLQRLLPQDPLQAFRRVVDDPCVVPALQRYEMIQNAIRAATAWIPGVPAEIRQRLPSQALEALQVVILRLTINQRTPSPAAQPTTINDAQTPQQPVIANQVLQEQQQRLPQGTQAGAPHYGLRPRSPRVPPAPQAVVPRTPETHSMDTTGSPKESSKRDTK